MDRIWLVSLAAAATFAACTLNREGGIEDAPPGEGGTGPGSGGFAAGPATGGAGTGSPTGPGTGGMGVGGMGGTGGVSVGGGPLGGGGMGGGVVCGSGSVCVAAPTTGDIVTYAEGGTCPTGWSGPVDLYEDNNLPGCNNSCSCGAPMGGSCAMTVESYTDSSCNNVKDAAMQVTAGNCVNVDESNQSDQADSYFFPPPTLTPGTCTGMGADKPAFMPLGTACSLPATPAQGGCDMGEVCVPAPNPNTGACVMIDGDQDCPATYTEKTLLFATLNDTRVCECNCDTEDGTCGEATMRLWNDNQCGSGQVANNGASNDCWDVSSFNQHDSYDVVGGAYQAGTCGVVEVAEGEVSLADPKTICCQP